MSTENSTSEKYSVGSKWDLNGGEDGLGEATVHAVFEQTDRAEWEGDIVVLTVEPQPEKGAGAGQDFIVAHRDYLDGHVHVAGTKDPGDTDLIPPFLQELIKSLGGEA